MAIEIIFQNQHWCAVLKPAEVLSVPSRLGDKDPRPCLKALLKLQLEQDVWPVHRLDYEVSGVILFALNKESHRVGNLWFEKGLINKTYEAVSVGSLVQAQLSAGLWKCQILRGKKRAYKSPHGAWAITEAAVNGEWAGGYLSWKLMPKTGRPHQLRFEMAQHGFPILGDELYGSQIKLKQGAGIALRARELKLSEEVQSERFGFPESISCKALHPVDIGVE